MLRDESLLALPSLPQVPRHETLPIPKCALTLRVMHFLHLSVTQWDSYRRDGEYFCPRAAPQPKYWALLRVCYRFKVPQGEWESLSSNSSLTPDLRPHVISEAIFMSTLLLSQMQFPTPLRIRLHHSTWGWYLSTCHLVRGWHQGTGEPRKHSPRFHKQKLKCHAVQYYR